eukprot:6731957-Pyramimonas_sp.AAC.1
MGRRNERSDSITLSACRAARLIQSDLGSSGSVSSRSSAADCTDGATLSASPPPSVPESLESLSFLPLASLPP